MSTRQSTRSVLRGICCLGLWSLSGLTHPAAVPRRWTVLTAPAVLTQTSARAARAEPREPRSYEEVIAESGLEDWSVKDYEAMRDDVPRTSKFEKAIQRRLQKQPQATVLDIGTGPFALLAVLAAKAGAKKVYAIEKNPEAAALAKETVERDGWKDVIEVIEGDSMQVTLPEQVDLVVSELIGSIATQEGVEPIIRDARQRFLKESEGACGMIPARCQTCIVPVLYKGRSFLQRVTAPFEGVRSRGKPQAGSSTPLRIKSADEGNLEFLSEPQVLEDFDYCAAANSPKKLTSTLEFPVAQEGTFSGFAMWTRVVVDDQEVIEVRGQPDSHWAYVVAVMTRYPQSVEPGTIKLVTRVALSLSFASFGRSFGGSFGCVVTEPSNSTVTTEEPFLGLN